MNAITGVAPSITARWAELSQLLEEEQWDDATSLARAWLAEEANPDAAAVLGYAALGKGATETAETIADHWLTVFVDEPRLLAIRAEARLRRGAVDDARQDAKRAVLLAPDQGAAWVIFAEALEAACDYAAAEEAFLAALACGDHAPAAFRAHRFARRIGREAKMLAALQAVEAERPLTLAESWCLGLLLAGAGDPHSAASAFRAALAEAHHTPVSILDAAADALATAGAKAEALGLLDRACALRPSDVMLALRRVNILRDLDRAREALAAIDAVLPQLSDEQRSSVFALKAYLHSRQGEHRDALEALAAFDQSGGEKSFSELAMVINLEAYASDDAARLLQRAHAIGDAAAQLSVCPFLIAGNRGNRLRIGLLSNGFGRHPVGWLTLPAFEALDKSRFSIVCFSTHERAADPLTARFRLAADEYVVLDGKSEDEACREILLRGCDLLIDLQGYSAHSMMGLVVRKPAPVIVKWVGMQAYSYGLPSIDVMLADDIEVPPQLEPFYTERIVRLPGSYICYLPPDPIPDLTPRPRDRNGYITFGFFNNLQKLSDPWLEAASRILGAVSSSRLVVKTRGLSKEEDRVRLLARMNEFGIDTTRVTLLGKTPHDEHLRAIAEADIALDSFPYSGGVTTLECALMGVPVIAKYGTSFASRHSLSHLTRLGLQELCADDIDAYVAKAISLAGDIHRLRDLRRDLRHRLLVSSGLCDAQTFARGLETILERLIADGQDSRPRLTVVKPEEIWTRCRPTLLHLIRNTTRQIREEDAAAFQTPFAIADDAVLALISLLAELRPQRVLELGSGLSTRLLAHLADQLGLERLVTVDDHAEWQQRVLRDLRSTARIVSLVAPLAPEQCSDRRGWFYQRLAERCGSYGPFDAVFIDGPRSSFGGPGTYNRSMAAGVIARLLRPGGLVILDDAWRQTEMEAMALWSAEGLVETWTLIDTSRGLAVARRAGAPPE